MKSLQIGTILLASATLALTGCSLGVDEESSPGDAETAAEEVGEAAQALSTDPVPEPGQFLFRHGSSDNDGWCTHDFNPATGVNSDITDIALANSEGLITNTAQADAEADDYYAKI